MSTGKPAAGGSKGGRFVVQRHRATRLHYDFRLEIDGVLASWAVPKGPTLDHKIRRMAVHVEDHPLEYFDFEGVIPKAQYGAGDVIVWDWGTYEPEAETPDPNQAIEDGELKFELHGQKLNGRFTLVRTSRRPGSAPTTAFEDDSEQWLLIKKRDASAADGWDPEEHPQSVKTGRTNDEVKEKREAIWVSDRPAATAEIDLAGAVEAPFPGFIPPMLATLASGPFSDPDWLFEVKWDGYRLQATINNGVVKTYTRRGLDGATYFPGLLAPASWIAAEQAIVDGEVVALDEKGAPDFGLLQEAISGLRSGGRAASPGGSRLRYQAFDLLYLDGRSLLRVPLEDRKRLLRSVLRETPRVRFASHVEADGVAFHKAAGELGLEGIVAKLRRSRIRIGEAIAGLAQDQDSARTGARRRRLHARRGQCQGPRGRRRRGVRGRPAQVRRARSGPGSTPGSARSSAAGCRRSRRIDRRSTRHRSGRASFGISCGSSRSS